MTVPENLDGQDRRFTRNELVRFQHCDPAGIVFYPRYVEMINATVEDWFAQVVEMTFADIHITQNVAMPIVALHVEFSSPAKLGDVLQFDVAIQKLGRTSIDLSIIARRDEKPILNASVTLVFVSKADYRSKPWPVEYRRRIEPEIVGSQAPG